MVLVTIVIVWIYVEILMVGSWQRCRFKHRRWARAPRWRWRCWMPCESTILTSRPPSTPSRIPSTGDIKTSFHSIEDIVNRCVQIMPKLATFFFWCDIKDEIWGSWAYLFGGFDDKFKGFSYQTPVAGCCWCSRVLLLNWCIKPKKSPEFCLLIQGICLCVASLYFVCWWKRTCMHIK
jgi:hypothetical protein